MKFFYDTEFLDDGKTIEFISIGIVREDGLTYYAVNRDADWERINRDPWLLSQLFGRMLDLPRGIPMFTNDLRSLVSWQGLNRWKMPRQEAGKHDALQDALHLKLMFETVAELLSRG